MFEELNKVVKKIFKESDNFIAKNKPITIINEEIYDEIEDKCLTEYKDPPIASAVAGRIYDEFMKEFDKWVEKLDVRGI